MHTDSPDRRPSFPLAAALLAVAALGLLTVAGCNTVEGAGEDIENLGDNIEDTAEDAQD